MSHIDVYRANIVTLSCSRSKRNAAAAAGLEGAATAAGRAGLRAGLGWGQARAAPRGRQTRANPHELASNQESTRTCCARACWNGTGTARNQASWNGSGRNIIIHEYAKNMQLYVKICFKYAYI